MYRCECTLYFSSLQQFFFSPLLRTDSRRNKYQFYILFLRVFFPLASIFSLLGTYFSLLDPSLFGQDLIYIITRTCLDLCNFYGPSVRISARYKTPNPLCFSSLLLPFIFSRSLCFFSPKISLLRLAHSLITSLASPIFRRLPNQTLITGCAQTLIYSQFRSFFLARYTQFH